MKNILCFAVIALLMPINTVFASSDWKVNDFKMGDDKACFVDTCGNNAFWFCGNQRSWCKSRDALPRHNQKTLYADEILTLEILKNGESDITQDSGLGSKYICCEGTTEKKGVFKENKDTTKDKTLDSGGTCKQTYNACGTLIKDCFTAGDGLCDDQPTKKLWRNNECVELSCGGEKAWESATSNTCITCPKETYPGRGPDDSGVCITCDINTQYYDQSQLRCRNIEEVQTKYTAAQLKRCWPCANNSNNFSSCIAGTTLPDSCLENN